MIDLDPQDTMIDLDPRDGDDRRFLGILDRMVGQVSDDVRELWLVRVDNWFNHKWLRFSGIGRVPFHSPSPSHPGVALDALSQDKLTFPPFSPKRILQQACWASSESDERLYMIHRRVLRHRATNLHRRRLGGAPLDVDTGLPFAEADAPSDHELFM